MLIERDVMPHLLHDAQKSPVIAILGPRQSGKTTLARMTFSSHAYVSLEELDNREFALRDPRAFLAHYQKEHGVIIDEIQHVPGLLSYIQTDVDLNYRPGFYVLTGSQNFLIMQAITQTLAGRISFHTLLGLSINELQKAKNIPTTVQSLLFKGSYPSIYSKSFVPEKWYADYIRSYIERDVRTLSDIGDLALFKRFLKLCAGRVGQLVNLTSLGNDCGISYQTIKSWLSILEASYIIFLLQPHHQNFNKRLIKTPKLYFYDVGLAANLLGIENEQQLDLHYMRGPLFESLVISELYKMFYNADKTPHIYFWRDKTGHEVDCIVEKTKTLYPIEIKAGQTISSDYFDGLSYWNSLAETDPKYSFVIYAGNNNQQRSSGTVLSWQSLPLLFNEFV